jgi:TolB-like protein/DNA-binding winged helix-turn-helix (wHTH) protein/Tfp pilus assembly protein PilF
MTVVVVRFEEFELDPRGYCLQRSGRTVKLERIPMELLVLLAERRGQLVTREEIIEKLWGKNVFLDTDNAINTAVRKIRYALKDDPEGSRFIQTVTGRGYRFIAPVEEGSQSTAQVSAAPASPTKPIQPLDSALRTRQSWKWVVPLLAVVLVIVGSAGYVLRTKFFPKPAAAQKRVMLAVLPFQNLSDDPQQEYFSDGLTEETITDLGELSPDRLGVIARTSAMAYKHTNKTAGQIGQELGVDYILEGSVRREGGRARISTQLIRVGDQTHVWAQSFDRELRDFLEVQRELGEAISEQVQVSLKPERKPEQAKTRQINPDAYDDYLKGLYSWNQFDPDSLKKSIQYFERAIEKDPGYAQAYAGLAESYGVLMDWNKLPPAEAYSKSEAAARRAVDLDSGNSEAHSALGWQLLSYDRDYAGSEREFQRAIELNASNADAHDGLANYFAIRGQFDQSIAEARRARDLDPLSLLINNDLGKMLFYARRYDEAIQQLRFTLDLHSDSFAPHYVFWLIYQEEGRNEEADAEFFKMTAAGFNPSMTEIQKTYAKLGWNGAWEKLVARKLVSSWDLAGVSLAVGDKHQTLDLLQKAADGRLSQVIFLNVDPRYDKLRDDPRFQDLLRRIGLRP